MEEQIEVVYNHKKRRLTILQGGKMVGGYIGKIATRLMEKIAYGNAKIIIEDGDIQIAV